MGNVALSMIFIKAGFDECQHRTVFGGFLLTVNLWLHIILQNLVEPCLPRSLPLMNTLDLQR
jgi:hypothetical protein